MQFTLDDFIAQMEQVRRLGPIGEVMGMIPGMSRLSRQMGRKHGDLETQMKHMRAMYDSMTREERKNPDLLDAWHRRRVSRGSGLEMNEVSQFLRQYDMAKNMMKSVG
ncbi:MAG: hypothetical protein ABSH22_05765 [Tepidisphaeraceae bacterium]|jgi:signal recognition particle subunit SRP54